ncbi:MAG: hypothetical protein V3S62_07200 [Acidimicrobiia bacterium]
MVVGATVVVVVVGTAAVVVAATVVVVLGAVVLGAVVVLVVDEAVVVDVPKIVEPDESSPHAAMSNTKAKPMVSFFKEPPGSTRNLLAAFGSLSNTLPLGGVSKRSELVGGTRFRSGSRSKGSVASSSSGTPAWYKLVL